MSTPESEAARPIRPCIEVHSAVPGSLDDDDPARAREADRVEVSNIGLGRQQE